MTCRSGIAVVVRFPVLEKHVNHILVQHRSCHRYERRSCAGHELLMDITFPRITLCLTVGLGDVASRTFLSVSKSLSTNAARTTRFDVSENRAGIVKPLLVEICDIELSPDNNTFGYSLPASSRPPQPIDSPRSSNKVPSVTPWKFRGINLLGSCDVSKALNNQSSNEYTTCRTFHFD